MTGEGPGTHSEMNIVSESELEAPDLQRSSSAHYKEKLNILRKRVKKRENRFKKNITNRHQRNLAQAYHKYGKTFFPYLGIKNMNIDYKKCHANSILIVCMHFVRKNTMVNAVDVRNVTTLRLSIN